MATKQKKEEKKPDLTLDKVLTDFKASWEYTEGSWHKRWQDNYDLYNNQRVKVGYKGITDTFVPMTFSTIETMTSALFGNKPKFDYAPPQEKQDQKTDILNALLDYYWDKDQWSVKVINWGRDFLRLGTSIVYLMWDKDHPVMVNVPIRDFFIDPTASTMENAKYMGRRYLISLDELKEYEVVNPETGEMEQKYKNLDKIGADTSTGDPTDKEEKDMWYGTTTPKGDQIEVIEYWTEDQTISIANRSVVIQNGENIYKTKARANKVEYPCGIMPFAALRDYVDASLFYAKGEVDFIADEQELLNDITNQNIDSITFTLNQMYTLDPKYAHLLNEIENLPGAVYLTEAGSLQPIAQRPVPPDAFNERSNLKNEIRETTASNEIVKGVGQDQTTTATEVNAQIAGAGQRMGLKVTQIENEGFHRLARVVFEMVKLYVTEKMMVRIIGKDGVKWEEFDPQDFAGEYEPRVQLDITMANKKAEDASIAKEMLGAFLGDPDVNQQELKKIVFQRSFDLDPDEVETLMTPAELPPEMGGMPEAMPGEMPMDAMGAMPMPENMGALPPEAPMELPPEPMPEEMPEIQQVQDPETGELIDVIVDPVTGELIPLDQALAEQMAIEQGAIA